MEPDRKSLLVVYACDHCQIAWSNKRPNPANLERIAAGIQGGFVAYDPKLVPLPCVLEAQIALQELLDLARAGSCGRDPDCIRPRGHDGPCEDEVGFRA